MQGQDQLELLHFIASAQEENAFDIDKYSVRKYM